MSSDSAIIPINSFSPAEAVEALVDQRGQHNLTTLHNLTADDLDAMQRQTYLEAQKLGVVQFLVSFVRQYGEQPPENSLSHVWQVNRARPPIALRIEVRHDGAIEVRVRMLGVTPEREIVVLSDFVAGKERMIARQWLGAVVEEYEAARQRREHAERLADRAARDERIGDLTAGV